MSRPLLVACFCLTVMHGTVECGEPRRSGVPAAVTDNDDILAEITVAKKGDVLLLPVTISGEKLNFVLDTGAVTNVLDRAVAKKLGPLQSSSQRYPDGFPVMFELPEAEIEGTKLPPLGDAACLDLSSMTVASGQKIDGIVGIRYLEQFKIQIDFDNGKVRFLNSTEDTLKNGMTISKEEFGRPLLDVELISGKIVPMIIDTGMAVPGVGEVNRATFRELLEADRIVVKGPPGRTISITGEMAGRKGKLDILSVGDFEHRQIGIREGSLNALGLDYLSRYHVTLDFPNNKLYLQKGQRFAEPTSFDMSGMAIVRIDGTTQVEKVHPDGPVYALGVRTGDRILRVAGKPAEAYSLLELRRLLAVNGQHVKLVVENETGVQDYDLTLKDWQPVAAKASGRTSVR